MKRSTNLSSAFERRAEWWDKFGCIGHGGRSAESAGTRKLAVGRPRGDARCASGVHAGESTGDISFWRTHVANSESIKAYALVVANVCAAAITCRDGAADAMAQRRRNGRRSSRKDIHSTHCLLQWMQGVLGSPESGEATQDYWPAVRRLFDFLEANAGSYWSVPTLAEALNRLRRARTRREGPTPPIRLRL